MIKTTKTLKKASLFCSAIALLSTYGAFMPAANAQATGPALIITHAPLPDSLKAKVYNTPKQVKEIKPQDITGMAYTGISGTTVGGEIFELQNDLAALQRTIESHASGLTALQREGEMLSSEYYSSVATINSQLRNGTTPGNPRLVSKLGDAKNSLQGLNANVSRMNAQAVQISDSASKAAYLLNSARSAYSLSGAVEEDHVQLAQLEDNVNNTVVIIERLLNTASDSIARTTAYLSTEQNNVRTLSLAVANGDLYGRSLSNRPFATAAAFSGNAGDFSDSSASMQASEASFNAQPQAVPAGGRPLAKIKFDRSDVEYEQALYIAMNEAIDRYPNARFDLVAVHPSQGNAAEVAIESTRARRNAERVLRTITDMGVPSERIDLAYDQSDSATSSEVHLYIK